jgi:hypothetical protein
MRESVSVRNRVGLNAWVFVCMRVWAFVCVSECECVR